MHPQAIAIRTMKNTAAINERLARIEAALGLAPVEVPILPPAPAPRPDPLATPTVEDVEELTAGLADGTPPPRNRPRAR